MKHPLLAAIAVTALAAPAVVAAQTGGGTEQPPYALPPSPTATPVPAVGVPVPAPRVGKAMVLQRVRGKVRYKVPSRSRFSMLEDIAQVPTGTRVDARRGRVRVIVARDRDDHRSRSEFYGGRFVLDQASSKPFLTTLTMIGGDFDACAEASASRVADGGSKRKRIRRLWGDGHGRFRTSGRYSAATVRGTKWLVEDRCDGTLTKVARGEVDVEDFADVSEPTPRPTPLPGGGDGGGEDGGGGEQPSASPAPNRAGSKRVRVRKGGSYVARPG